MKCLLDALHEGRLIELPDNDKTDALRILASLIEAIPDINNDTDVAESVIDHEKVANTGFGLGWAFPHVRSARDGDLVCAVGWSPAGIDYGSADGEPVHIIVMYFIPANQMNVYLKEVSTVARLLKANEQLHDFAGLGDLVATRHRLLDVISAAVETGVLPTKARMIKLEARQPAEPATAPAAPVNLASIIPLSVIMVQGRPPLVLAQNAQLVESLEHADDLSRGLSSPSSFAAAGYRIVVRGSTLYLPNRKVWDCFAIPEAEINKSPAPR